MNPFTALRLTPGPGLTDEDVRAAWRSAAAATHPDRADGGNPAAYAAAAAAYEQLRAPLGTLGGTGRPGRHAARAARPGPRPAAMARALGFRRRPACTDRPGRARRLIIRALLAAAAATCAVLLVPGTASGPAVTAGCGLWWLLTARADLAPPPGR